MLTCRVCSATIWEGARHCPACGTDLSAQPAAEVDEAKSLIGRKMGGKFVLRELIGSGATGHVFRADQTTLGRTVAVKVLREHVASDAEVVRRFHQEALAASRLNHPNAVAVIDYGQTEDAKLYIVMEFLRGRTLTEVLRAEYPMAVSRAIALATQVLDALEEAHAAGVVHADLKSDNVVVETRRSGGDQVKVVDFGISRILDAPGIDDESVCGTPEYMAPEIISGGELTAAADQYGAAVVLYEMLTGVTPFSGGTTTEVLRRQLTDPPPRPGERSPGLSLPPGLEAAILKALAKRPEDRFASVADLRNALTAVLQPGQGTTLEGGRKCAECGAENPARFKFCPECGARVEVTTIGKVVAPRATTREVRTETMRWAPVPPPVWPLPLFGRTDDLAALTAFLAGGGVSQTIIVSAEVGLGKTRLVQEGIAAASEKGIHVTLAGPDPSGLASAWYPIRAAVAAILSLPPICPVDALVERLEAAQLSTRDAPGLAELFGMESSLSQLEPVVRRRECTAAALRVLRSAGSRVSRAALVFEDVEQFDALSLDLLQRLAQHPIETSLRVVLTTTPKHADGFPADVARLSLAPLGAEAMEGLSAHLRVSQPGAPAGDTLLRITRGEPARAEHAMRRFFEGAELASLPDGLADLIADRLGLLPADVRLCLQAISVAGLETQTGVLAGVVVGQVDETSLGAALDLLGTHGLVDVTADVVSFAHPLVRDVVYDGIPADVRRALHRGLAENLKAHATPVAILGHHADLGGLHELAVTRLIAAGDEAVRRFDDHGAVAFYQRAMACARRSLHIGDQSGEPSGRLRDALTAAIKLADTLRLVGNLALARGVIDEARFLCDGTSRALEAQLRRVHGYVMQAAGDDDKALTCLREAIGIAMTAGSLELVAALYLDVATVHTRKGAPQEAAAELQEGIDFVTMGEGVKARSGPRSLWRMAARLAELQTGQGRRQDAIATATCALRHAMRVHSTAGRGRANGLLARLYEGEGDLKMSARHRAAAVEEMRTLGDRRSTSELLFESHNTGQFRIGLDSLEEARTLAAEVADGDERPAAPMSMS